MNTRTIEAPTHRGSDSIAVLRSGRRTRGREIAACFTVCLTVGVYCIIPLLFNPLFYYDDDAATRFLPVWHHLGKMIASGAWPPLLELEMWGGGNLVGEAAYGVYNPINALTYLLVYALPDLALAAAFVVAGYSALLALGVYLLGRDYGAARWAAAAIAIAVPFAGFTLYFGAGAWPSDLISFAYVPHVWWSLRRVSTGRLNAFWAFLIGALAVSAGYPYGLLAIAVVAVALLIEFSVRQWRRPVVRLLLVGLCIAAVIPLIYLPLLALSAVTWRSTAGISNTGFLVPGIGDWLTMSLPLYLAEIQSWPGTGTTWNGSGMSRPVMYLAWFVAPLVPWLSWHKLREHWRPLSGLLVLTLIYLLLMLGPSNFWLFRWPLRYVGYFYLGIAVLFAVMLSRGLRRDRWHMRIAATAAVLLVGAYLSFAATPDRLGMVLASLALLAVLSTLALALYRRPYGHLWLAGMLCLGTAATLTLQTYAIPGKPASVRTYLPHSVEWLQKRFDDRYRGATVQIASDAVTQRGSYRGGVYQDFLFGSTYLPAGVTAVNQFMSMAPRKFADALCMDYVGAMCAEAYAALWDSTRYGEASLADLMKIQTVVVQNALVPDARVPPGWAVVEHDKYATVLRRHSPLQWQEGRLSWASPGLRVTTDHSNSDAHEIVQLERRKNAQGTQQLVFARLAWPGYQARIGGQTVPVTPGPAGLLTVTVPANVEGGTLTVTWQPPGFVTGTVVLGLGVLGAASLGAWDVYRRRRSTTRPRLAITFRSSGRLPT